jgi:hypothetical protein
MSFALIAGPRALESPGTNRVVEGRPGFAGVP